MIISTIHHVALIVSDYQKSKHFYINTLGFKKISEIYRSERNSYKLNLELPGKIQLEIFSFEDPPKRLSYPESCGLRHLAFGCYNLEKSIKELFLKGVICEPIRTDELTKKKFTFFFDPDNLPLELYEIE